MDGGELWLRVLGEQNRLLAPSQWGGRLPAQGPRGGIGGTWKVNRQVFRQIKGHARFGGFYNATFEEAPLRNWKCSEKTNKEKSSVKQKTSWSSYQTNVTVP